MTRKLPTIAAVLLMASTSAWAAGADTGAYLAMLESAARDGDPRAQTDLAVRYEHAEGVPQDLQKARLLYCQAARQGFPDAQFKLGWVYANGRGVPRDDGVAAVLFEMAGEQGHEHAIKLLQYVRRQSDTQLPSCLLPDPPQSIANAESAEESALADRKGQGESDETEPADELIEPGSERGKIQQLVYRIAPQYAVDPKLAMAVITVESAFNPGAVSPMNAQGLMQLIPETAERFGVKRVFNPVDNIKGGLAYLRWLLAFFQGDVVLVVAAYNAGERAVEKYRGIPPYAETRRYVQKITEIYRKTRHPYQSAIVEPSSILARMTRARTDPASRGASVQRAVVAR